MNKRIPLPLHAGEKARKRGIHPGFETQGRRDQKSKTGVSVAPQKGLVSSKFFFKKKKVHGTCADLNVETLRKETLVSSLTYVRSVGLSFPLAYIAI